MGIDYARFRLRQPQDSLHELIAAQALAAQAIWGTLSHFGSDLLPYKLRNALHLPYYRKASEALFKNFEFPIYDQETQTLSNYPELDSHYRVSAISSNPIFPLLWRVQAYTTILPDQLATQLERWRNWAVDIVAGKHTEYLTWLHAYNIMEFMPHHATWMREIVCCAEAGGFEFRGNTSEIRDRILRLNETIVIEPPIVPEEYEEELSPFRYEEALHQAKICCELSKAWNEAVPEYKFDDYSSNYSLSLTDFRTNAADEFLAGFFEWAQRCADLRFGLFFDY